MATADFTISNDDLFQEGHFADIGDDGTWNGFTQTKTFYQGTNTTSIRHVCIVLDYYRNAMEFFYSVNLGKAFLNDYEHDVPFNIDWKMVI